MQKSRPPIELRGVTLAELQRLIEERTLPPVENWNPDHCGHSEMRIARDGTWYHQGSPIRRAEMVQLFSTILRREPDGRHVLVTPVEKLEIEVDSTAFRAIQMRIEGNGLEQKIAFLLDSGDATILGPQHPLRVIDNHAGLSPRIAVRHGLEAELSRSVYYELAELALSGEPGGTVVMSDGAIFQLEPQP